MSTNEHTQLAWSEPFYDADHRVQTYDMGRMMLDAYELGDMINQSAEMAEYLYWKTLVEQDEQIQRETKRFAKAKEAFEETERFGRFHPDYHAAKDKVKSIQQELDAIPSVSRFKVAEKALDELLHEVATQLAGSISETIKVPGNEKAGGGCGSGGSCSCGSGGCG
ncbi:YlbF family regulator [Paenibacillus xanthanilyticus]|uniref:YlbF family regulator n=1 Tax=Paenibacillus xanthanilyticus TaxID=1783531 RepID=A0ABV8K4K4_9BACL